MNTIVTYLQRLSIIGLSCSTFFLSTAAAQSSCDTCSQLSQLNTTTQSINTNTATSSNTLSLLTDRTTLALFGALPAVGNGDMMAAFSIMPQVQKNSYDQQKTLLQQIEKEYQGSSTKNETFKTNYTQIFGDYLLKQDDSVSSFDKNNASISALYIDPTSTEPYSEAQEAAAATYIKLVSGVALSQMRQPSSDWLTIGSSDKEKDEKNVRSRVSTYYTLSAMQSAIADNFAYIYGLNKGTTMSGTLDGYQGKTISESSLFHYIESQKTENKDWYTQLSGMGIIGLLKEQTILIAGCFMMLVRIEEDLRRLLITNSVQASSSLVMMETLSEKLADSSKTPKI